jgi:hypothetical protein
MENQDLAGIRDAIIGVGDGSVDLRHHLPFRINRATLRSLDKDNWPHVFRLDTTVLASVLERVFAKEDADVGAG